MSQIFKGIKISQKVIRFQRHGCTNRPFFHIVVAWERSEQYVTPIEQVGVYDPLPNQFNEKLVSFNMDRIHYWMSQGAEPTKPVAELLGLIGYLPIHPRTRMTAWRANEALAEEASKKEESKQETQISKEESSTS